MSPYEHASAPIDSIYGRSTMHDFSFGPNEQDNVLVVEVHRLSSKPPLVRVQSACYSGEIFRSSDCDCHEQLDRSLRRIHAEGGLFVYMLADGRGAGLLAKLRGLALGASEGLDTFDAYQRLGVPGDPRSYENVSEVLHHFDLRDVRLLTNNPSKISALSGSGFKVRHEPIQIAPTALSGPYLEAKRVKFGHLLAPWSPEGTEPS